MRGINRIVQNLTSVILTEDLKNKSHFKYYILVKKLNGTKYNGIGTRQ